MNRAYTVWLDVSQHSGPDASTVTDAVAPVPSFTMPLPLPLAPTQPMTKKEMVVRLLHFLWARRATLVGLVVVWRLLMKLRALSQSKHVVRALCGPLNVRLFPQYILSPSTGLWLFTRSWRVPPAHEKGIVFIQHAYREHIGRYEPLAAALNAAGYSVYGHDHIGHGQSGGERGYVESFACYVLDSLTYMRHIQAEMSEAAQANGQDPSAAVKPCFLLGHSMGATIALHMARAEEWRVAAEEEDALNEEEARQLQLMQSPNPASADAALIPVAEEAKEQKTRTARGARDRRSRGGARVGASSYQEAATSSTAASSSVASSVSPRSSPRWRLSGLVLSSPALIPHLMSPLLQSLASVLADTLPKCRPLGTLQDPALLSDLSSVTAQWSADPLTLRQAMPARWGAEMLAAMSDARDACADLTLPVLLAQGRRDRYISPMGAQYALDHLASADKTLRWYDAGAHDLFLDVVRTNFISDTVNWLQKHTDDNEAHTQR